MTNKRRYPSGSERDEQLLADSARRKIEKRDQEDRIDDLVRKNIEQNGP
jgi:hypothetical protein